MRVRLGRTANINEHLTEIKKQVDKSLRDGETRQLAVKIVSGSFTWSINPRTGQEDPYIKAWNLYLLAPPDPVCAPRDAQCELVRIWNFVILNFRYVYDPDEVDTFCTAKVSLEAGGGDCDDAAILIGALARSVGFKVRARVIATADNPGEWVHVYPLVGLPKDNPTTWMPLDMTVTGFKPGDEYHDIAQSLDFDL